MQHNLQQTEGCCKDWSENQTTFHRRNRWELNSGLVLMKEVAAAATGEAENRWRWAGLKSIEGRELIEEQNKHKNLKKIKKNYKHMHTKNPINEQIP